MLVESGTFLSCSLCTLCISYGTHVTHPFSGLARRSLTKTNRKIAYNLHGSASSKLTKFHSNGMSGLARHKVRTHTNIHFYLLDYEL
jgi:hypothetical protein